VFIEDPSGVTIELNFPAEEISRIAETHPAIALTSANAGD
jgi:hypothetical protein